MLTFFLALFLMNANASTNVNGNERTPAFEKEVKSATVKVTCTGEINDVFIFSLNLVDLNQAHEFLVMKGLDPETCTALRSKIQKILKGHKKVTISGFSGFYDKKSKAIVHQWKLVKGKHVCISWFPGDCGEKTD